MENELYKQTMINIAQQNSRMSDYHTAYDWINNGEHILAKNLIGPRKGIFGKPVFKSLDDIVNTIKTLDKTRTEEEYAQVAEKIIDKGLTYTGLLHIFLEHQLKFTNVFNEKYEKTYQVKSSIILY
ncbi:MAG: hypothetical protein NTV63_00285 [Candidatus Woesearchaeota archaeon]|nr:hypothetical protein [Candidatus Woesearchaeota archaeon]